MSNIFYFFCSAPGIPKPGGGQRQVRRPRIHASIFAHTIYSLFVVRIADLVVPLASRRIVHWERQRATYQASSTECP
jgi:hypothetical protein